jgi:hypothetical protein
MTDDLIQLSIDAAVRVSREGGVASVVLPDPETGKLVTFEIDQAGARDVLAALLDSFVSDLWKQIRDGKLLTPSDRQYLIHWTAATVTEHEAAERERRAASMRRRAELYVVKGDQP